MSDALKQRCVDAANLLLPSLPDGAILSIAVSDPAGGTFYVSNTARPQLAMFLKEVARNALLEEAKSLEVPSLSPSEEPAIEPMPEPVAPPDASQA